MTTQKPFHIPVLAPTTELVGAVILGRLNDDSLERLKADARGYILATTKIEISDTIKINVVMNTKDTVALALPYYESIELVRAEKARQQMELKRQQETVLNL